MDCEMHPIILHFIKEVLDFKTFVHGYLGIGGDFLGGYSKSQQFKFSKDSTWWPIMRYKNLCTNKNSLLEQGKGICLWSETKEGCPMMPNEALLPLTSHQMKSHEEVKKDLKSFIIHWNQMANDHYSRKFKWKNGPIKG